MLTTSDGGARWTVEHPGLGHNGNLYAVWFVDARHGWIIGSGGVIEATVNGGRTWTAQHTGTHQDLESVQFVNRHDGWIQDAGGILRTTNGGATWTRVYTASSQRSELVAGQMFLNTTLGWASGSQTDSSANHGLVSETTNGGRTWTPTTSPASTMSASARSPSPTPSTAGSPATRASCSIPTTARSVSPSTPPTQSSATV